jgi:hypothetical protein
MKEAERREEKSRTAFEMGRRHEGQKNGNDLVRKEVNVS